MDFRAFLADSIRDEYQRHGAGAFYQKFGNDYINPHENRIQEALKHVIEKWNLNLNHVLDLAAGSGEITRLLNQLGYHNIQATDPYTAKLYTQKTGKKAWQNSFEDIALGKAPLLKEKFSIIICSYAMHLLDSSWLPQLLVQLKQVSPYLLIISPHKNPAIKSDWGWKLRNEVTLNRVHVRLYERTGTY